MYPSQKYMLTALHYSPSDIGQVIASYCTEKYDLSKIPNQPAMLTS